MGRQITITKFLSMFSGSQILPFVLLNLMNREQARTTTKYMLKENVHACSLFIKFNSTNGNNNNDADIINGWQDLLLDPIQHVVGLLDPCYLRWLHQMITPHRNYIVLLVKRLKPSTTKLHQLWGILLRTR